jgi:hypothetical protein
MNIVRRFFYPKLATRQKRHGFLRIVFIAAAVPFLFSVDFAEAQSLRQGMSAFNRQDYALASRIFIPLAWRRYGQPDRSARRHDPVAVVPVPLHILSAVEHDIKVGAADEIEKPLPRNIA